MNDLKFIKTAAAAQDEFDTSDEGKREGIRIEKGAIVTADYLASIEPLLRKYFDLFCTHPDLFVDLIKPIDLNFQLYFYQRLVLRVIMRYKDVFITACRAFSKSFISIFGQFLQCIFMPGNCFCPFTSRGVSKKLSKSGKPVKTILRLRRESRNKKSYGIWCKPKFCEIGNPHHEGVIYA